jgi:hypothetical protein
LISFFFLLQIESRELVLLCDRHTPYSCHEFDHDEYIETCSRKAQTEIDPALKIAVGCLADQFAARDLIRLSQSLFLTGPFFPFVGVVSLEIIGYDEYSYLTLHASEFLWIEPAVPQMLSMKLRR